MTVYLAKSSKRYGKVSMRVALKWARRQLSEMIPWNMAEGVDGIPNLGVGQGKKKGGQPEAERKRVCIASAAQEKGPTSATRDRNGFVVVASATLAIPL